MRREEFWTASISNLKCSHFIPVMINATPELLIKLQRLQKQLRTKDPTTLIHLSMLSLIQAHTGSEEHDTHSSL